MTAPVGDVITPIFFGRNGNFFLYWSSNKPSSFNFFFFAQKFLVGLLRLGHQFDQLVTGN